MGYTDKGHGPVTFLRRQLQGPSLGFGCLSQPALHLQRLTQHGCRDQGQVGLPSSLTQPDGLGQSLDGCSWVATAQGGHAQDHRGNAA